MEMRSRKNDTLRQQGQKDKPGDSEMGCLQYQDPVSEISVLISMLLPIFRGKQDLDPEKTPSKKYAEKEIRTPTCQVHIQGWVLILSGNMTEGQVDQPLPAVIRQTGSSPMWHPVNQEILNIIMCQVLS